VVFAYHTGVLDCFLGNRFLRLLWSSLEFVILWSLAVGVFPLPLSVASSLCLVISLNR